VHPCRNWRGTQEQALPFLQDAAGACAWRVLLAAPDWSTTVPVLSLSPPPEITKRKCSIDRSMHGPRQFYLLASVTYSQRKRQDEWGKKSEDALRQCASTIHVRSGLTLFHACLCKSCLSFEKIVHLSLHRPCNCILSITTQQTWQAA
jgi:hypothetical protein